MLLQKNNTNTILTKIGLLDCFAKGYGTYDEIKEMNNLKASNIYEIIKNAMTK